MSADKVRENYLRRQARRLGLYLKKSRARKWSVDNQGGYMIVIADMNAVAAGERFELDLEDVADFLDDYEESLREQ